MKVLFISLYFIMCASLSLSAFYVYISIADLTNLPFSGRTQRGQIFDFFFFFYCINLMLGLSTQVIFKSYSSLCVKIIYPLFFVMRENQIFIASSF